MPWRANHTLRYENVDGGFEANGGAATLLASGASLDGVIDVACADVDGDGALDVVASSLYADAVMLFLNDGASVAGEDGICAPCAAIGDGAQNCDYWSSSGLCDAEWEGNYGCDCSGCACSTYVRTAPTMGSILLR